MIPGAEEAVSAEAAHREVIDLQVKSGSLIIRLAKRMFSGSRQFILSEVLGIRGFMQLLMKRRNTGEKWTASEIAEIKRHLKSISKAVPALIIFVLPGGAFLLPLFAAFLDRRQRKR